jgi:hypothetical protein
MSEKNTFIVLKVSFLPPDVRLSDHFDSVDAAIKLSGCRAPQCGQHIRSAPTGNMIQRSSVVERSAVNRLVVGSNPTAGAK